MDTMRPKVGDYIHTDRLGEVEIVRIREFGTVDVRHPATDRYFRVSGLMGADWRCIGKYHPAPGTNSEPLRWVQP